MSHLRQQLVALILAAASLAAQPLTPQSFDAELSRIDQEIQANIPPNLPDSWQVRAGSHDYNIPSAPLRSFFRGANGSSPDEARAWIASMRRNIESFDTPRPPAKPARALLDEILTRNEFRPPPPPNALERLWERIRAAVIDWIESLFNIAAQHPTEARIFFWALIASIVGGLCWYLSKFLRKEPSDLPLPAPPMQVVLRSWQEWMKAARDAAARGEYREAIRDSYWAGITRLQLDRTIHINLTDTPRERLHSVTAPTRRYQPLPAPELESLTAVTKSFERVWYADLPATAEDVDQAFTHLETLGCKAG